MDYQTFNGQHHLPSSLGGAGGQFSTSIPGSSTPASTSSHAQTTHTPSPHNQHQHQSVYGDPQARFQQQQHNNANFQFNSGQGAGFSMASNMGGGGNMTGGAMMQPGNLSQHQLHHQRALQQSPSPYTSAPYSQPLTSPAVSAAQRYGQQFHKTASPAGNHVSPYATPSQQQSPRTNPSPQQQGQMAAPPSTQSQSAQSMQQQVHTPVKAVPHSPASPGDLVREKERVAVLLEINSHLLQQVVTLQQEGKSGQINSMPPPKEEGKTESETKTPSKEYVESMRRLQANLSYLATTADSVNKPHVVIPPGPAIMSVPQAPPILTELYTKLQGLFPGWKGPTQQQRPGMPQQNSSQGSLGHAGQQNNMQQQQQGQQQMGQQMQ